MTYSDFEQQLHTLVLEAGSEYFEKGAVVSLEQTRAGWKAIVKGTRDYEVVLSGLEGLEAWICDCPYDHGPVCKHVSATLFAVKDKVIQKVNESLDGKSLDDLRDLILNAALDSQSFRERLDG